MKILWVAPNQLDIFWPLAEPWITEALHDVPETSDMYLAEAYRGQALVWVIGYPDILGAMVTRLLVSPKNTIIEVVALAGHDMPKWFQDVHQCLQYYMYESHADYIEFQTARNAGRFLKVVGFQESRIVYRSYNDEREQKPGPNNDEGTSRAAEIPSTLS